MSLQRKPRAGLLQQMIFWHLPGDEGIIHRDGDRLVIEPVRKRGLLALLKTMKPFDGDFPEIDDSVPKPEKVF